MAASVINYKQVINFLKKRIRHPAKQLAFSHSSVNMGIPPKGPSCSKNCTALGYIQREVRDGDTVPCTHNLSTNIFKDALK